MIRFNVMMPVLLIALATSQIRAQDPAPRDIPVKAVPATPTLPKDGAPVPAPSVAQNFAPAAGWPSPTDDHHVHSYILFDNLEYQRVRGGINALNWTIRGWRGGDVNRFWFKSEGFETSKLGIVGAQVDGQALYGRAISPYFCF